MADTSPSQQQYPNLNPYTSTNGNSASSAAEGAKSSMANSEFHPQSPSVMSSDSALPNAAASAMDSIKNHPTVQSLSNGPLADKARTEASLTQDQLSSLAGSRQTPTTQTADGQHLTHYHSFFYNLLTWENPRATGLAYGAIVLLVFVTRYVPVVRYALKALYIVLGITAAAEAAGQLVMGQGVSSKLRPRRYYTIPRETLESVMEDLVELSNFFVIEFQRVVFAENVWVTIGAFTTALISYFLIKITPAWGLTLLFTTLAFFTPLLYIQNQALIDGHLANAQDVVNKQTAQIRDIASQHTNKAMEMSSSALKDYGARASEYVGGAKKMAVDKGVMGKETADKLPGGAAAGSGVAAPEVKKEDFPSAPQTEPIAAHDGTTEEEKKEPVPA